MINLRFWRRKKGRLPAVARVTLFFFDRPRFTVGLWLIIFTLGIASYTSLLKREGFPDVSVPYSFVNGVYLVNDPQVVDEQIGKPVSEIVAGLDNVKFVDSTSGANFFNIVIQFEDGTSSDSGNLQVEQAVKQAGVLPKEAMAEFKPLSPEVNERGDDMLVAVYDKNGSASTQELVDKGQKAAGFIGSYSGAASVGSAELIDPFVRGINPATGQPETSQKTFDRLVLNTGGQDGSYESVEVGIKGVEGFDVLALDKEVQAAVADLNASPEFEGFGAQISYSLAPSINDQINELQQALVEGLIAVLIVSAILIAVRAALISVASMILVIMATLAGMLAIGYSLNTITLFSLILCLALIVDDTVIMVEAIDAQRRRSKKARETVEKSAVKIARVMVAATLTATIGFVPLLFIGGILGEFVIAIPVTVIMALLISLVVALTFIPVMSKYLLLRPKQLGKGLSRESAAHHLERFIAAFLVRPILWMKHSRRRQFGLGLSAVVLGLAFIVGGGLIFQKIPFNIFAPSRDADQLLAQFTFEQGQGIDGVQETTDRANELIAQNLGDNLKQASLYGAGNEQSASLYIDLVSYKKRDATAPELSEQLEKAFAGFEGALVKVNQLDVGPPASAFTVRVETDNREAAFALAGDLKEFLETVELERIDGSTANLKAVSISSPDLVNRRDGKAYISVSAGEFSGTDTSTLVALSEEAVNQRYTAEKLAEFGLGPETIQFDIGAEEDFQNSFNAMIIAFPILLVAIYILLVWQFRSLLQPALIFMAIPFSLFGITGGLWLTDNAFSFFTMLGFFALLGLSIKNTILLTDYANQARREGHGAIDAVAISLQERFRPLLATSFAAIVALIPLYLSNPFWEGLTVTLIFGLLSSTLLVITIFPYYYLGSEYLRLRVSRRLFGLWLVLVVALSAGLVLAGQPALVPLVVLAVTLSLIVYKKRAKVRAA